MKKFFWSVVASSVLMIAVQISPLGAKFRSHMAGQLKQLRGQPDRAIASAPEEVQEVLPAPEARGGILTTEELKNTLSETESISGTSNEYIIDNEQYVLINGKYYKAREDNTYMVDGEKVFFVSNRSQRGKDIKTVKPSLSSSDFDMPVSPQEMMETMRRAQENMKLRDQMLEEIDENH